MKKNLIIFLFCALYFAFFTLHSKAQDFHLSQYDAAHLYLNPALTGMFNGDYRAGGHFRSQWAAVATKPFVTTMLSYDMPKDRFGVGGYIMNSRAGSGGFNVLNFLLSGAYEITTDPKFYNHLSVGLQLGFIHKYFNYSKYLFDNQYSNTFINDNGNRGGFDGSLPNGEEGSFENRSVLMPEANMGVYYYNTNDQITVTPFGGFNLLHILSPKEEFLIKTEGSKDNRLPRRLVIHSGLKIYATDQITVVPNILFMRQANNNEFKFGVLGYYKLKDSETELIFGPSYRNKDAVIIHLGMIHKDFIYRVSYDINTSSLNTVSNYRGGFEISIIYQKRKTLRLPSIE